MASPSTSSTSAWRSRLPRPAAALLTAALLATACAGPAPDPHPGAGDGPRSEKGYHECAFCGRLVSGESIVELEHHDRWYRSCIECRDHFEGLIEARRDAMTDRVDTFMCDHCGKIWTVPASEPASSCCGHRMRRQ